MSFLKILFFQQPWCCSLICATVHYNNPYTHCLYRYRIHWCPRMFRPLAFHNRDRNDIPNHQQCFHKIHFVVYNRDHLQCIRQYQCKNCPFLESSIMGRWSRKNFAKTYPRVKTRFSGVLMITNENDVVWYPLRPLDFKQNLSNFLGQKILFRAESDGEYITTYSSRNYDPLSRMRSKSHFGREQP